MYPMSVLLISKIFCIVASLSSGPRMRNENQNTRVFVLFHTQCVLFVYKNIIIVVRRHARNLIYTLHTHTSLVFTIKGYY